MIPASGLAIAVADALTTAFESLQVEFSFLPQTELKELGETPRVFVVPRDSRFVSTARSTTEAEHSIDVGVWAKLGGTGNDEVARVHAVTQQIADWALRKRFGAYLCTALEFQTLYDPAELLERNTFASVIGLTLRGTE